MYQRLRGKIAELNIKRDAIADCWQCNIMTVSNKLNGKTPIACRELVEFAQRFGLSESEVLYILFGPRTETAQA